MKQILSALMAVVLVAAGCADPGKAPARGDSGEEAAQLARTLAQAAYPEFPQLPATPEEGPVGSWDAYMEAYDQYTKAVMEIRGGGVTERQRAALNTFASKSTPLALAGRQGENAVYSPLSLWSALAMLAQCASGSSRQQALDALGAANAEQLQEDVACVWKALYTDDGASSLILANSIWLNSGMEGVYVQETLDTLAQKYFAGAYAVPMGTGEADRAVTNWVKEQTNGLIGGDSPVVQTKAETLALLASSLYYRAGWTDEFPEHLTEEDIFTNAADQESRVDFMHMTRNANFIRGDRYQAARLQTQLGEMVFVLPDKGTAPEALLQEPEFLSRLEFYGDACTWGKVQWSVPKFDVDSDLNLMNTLSSLGVTDLLDENKANLSALTSQDAFVSDAKQLARVKVDEEGVEAAAVTMIMMEPTSALIPEELPVCVMDLERPFLFVIRTQDVPLFVGVVNQI